MKTNALKIWFTLLLVLVTITSCKNNKKMITIISDDLNNGYLKIQSIGGENPVYLRSNESIEIPSGSIAIEAIGEVGYDFSYWIGLDEEESQVFLEIEEDLKIGAVFNEESYMLTVNSVENGNISIDPEIVSGTRYPANTLFNITATPKHGFDLDSIYNSLPGPWWIDYFETSNSTYKFRLTSDMTIGASFIDSEINSGLIIKNDIVYAKPGVKELKYDLYLPDSRVKLPLLVIVHGGGWTSNNEDVMRGMAKEIAKSGQYIVASVDYRWIGHNDGDPIENNLQDLIGDVYGAMAHIIERADEYGIDTKNIFITGDSAGGYLSAAAVTLIERIGSEGFNHEKSKYEIVPTYLPKDMSVDKYKFLLLDSIKAVAPSYGVLDIVDRVGSMTPNMTSEEIEAVNPLANIPFKKDRNIPHFIVLGSEDPLISPEIIITYINVLNEHNQESIYHIVPNAGHAFFDWKPDLETQETFNKYGVPYISKMIEFFNSNIE